MLMDDTKLLTSTRHSDKHQASVQTGEKMQRTDRVSAIQYFLPPVWLFMGMDLLPLAVVPTNTLEQALLQDFMFLF